MTSERSIGGGRLFSRENKSTESMAIGYGEIFEAVSASWSRRVAGVPFAYDRKGPLYRVLVTFRRLCLCVFTSFRHNIQRFTGLFSSNVSLTACDRGFGNDRPMDLTRSNVTMHYYSLVSRENAA